MSNLDARVRLEGVTVHVSQKAVKHLPGHGAFFKVACEVDAANKEFSPAHPRLEDQAELAVGVPVVDHLDDGAKFRRELIQDHEPRSGYKIPPLPVAVKFRGEMRQGLMIRLH